MPIDRLDFHNLGEGDLAELVAGQVREGLRIEYKRDLYGNADQDKREALEDISAFANAFGGHLILGIEAHQGIPVALPGLPGANPDDTILWFEQLTQSGIEPRIQGLRVRAVRLANSAHCVVLRVPKSWYPPHRVSAQNSNRYWIRNSGGVHEASMEEMDRVRQFRDDRINLITDGAIRMITIPRVPSIAIVFICPRA
jgi:predicted HTH transcriptional regulator